MQQDIQVLIIEDEPHWSASLERNLLQFGFGIAGIASNFEQAVVALNGRSYDLVLLDININGRDSGLELGKMISSIYQKPYLFITANNDRGTIAKAVTSRPSAYLLKPVSPPALFAAIQTAIQNFREQAVPETTGNLTTDSFFVKQGERYKKIFWKEVVYLSSEKNYTSVFNAADQQAYFIRSSLAKMLRFLIPAPFSSGFVQISRSEAVQLAYVQELAGNTLSTGFRVFQVGEAYLKEVKDRLHIII